MKNEEFENFKDNYKLIDWINKNYGWIIGVGTIFIALITGIFKVIEYWQINTSFALYGIDYNFYESKNIGNFNTIFSNIIIFTLISSGILSIYYLKNEKTTFDNTFCKIKKTSVLFKLKRKIKYYKENIYIILCFFLSNAFLIYYILSEFSLMLFIANFLILLISEWFFVKINFATINKENKVKNINNNDNLKKEVMRSLISLPILIFIIIICFTFTNTINTYEKREYRIINENKVVIYTNENYYIVLDCEVKESDLIIYRGTQQKIENNLIPTKLNKFNNVTFN